jgi:hypothetical protein
MLRLDRLSRWPRLNSPDLQKSRVVTGLDVPFGSEKQTGCARVIFVQYSRGGRFGGLCRLSELGDSLCFRISTHRSLQRSL